MDDLLTRALDSRVPEVVPEPTRLDAAPLLSARLRTPVAIKREDLTAVFSFKIRGAYNRISRLDSAERSAGVVAASAGNHAQGVAFAARKLGIPCRIVNGFKGGDWNDLARVLTVRQMHAHSWVEAFLGDDGTQERRPIWLTLDATPPADRAESVARAHSVPLGIRELTDFVRYVWVFYIAGFDAARQEKLLYGPIRDLFREAREGFGIMGLLLGRSVAGDWVSFDATIQDFLREASPVAILAVLAVVLEVFTRPTSMSPRQPLVTHRTSQPPERTRVHRTFGEPQLVAHDPPAIVVFTLIRVAADRTTM